MHLEVYIGPDQDRIDGIYKHPLDPTKLWKMEKDKPVPERFIVTCYEDVVKWADENRYRMWPGCHWYCLNIGKPDGELMYWEMPRGDQDLEDRLWKIIELYGSFYEDIP